MALQKLSTTQVMFTWSHFHFCQHLIHEARKHPWCQIVVYIEEYTCKTCGFYGLSKPADETGVSKDSKQKGFGVIPYIAPKVLSDGDNYSQASDIYKEDGLPLRKVPVEEI
ncbi:hypothetical protein Glove_26g299 [Diversispora epigaea]|uniref:Protein kinase domain-containing protein n=1 Tax=Diversispora epigaea TaxID=1348612 RepID=A0A397JJ97_9GLOM|nr:hypothetical protein Glove_26g299 [Diversispora epigaea]